ncbi:MAG: hypothetical protein ACR2GD_00555 [Pyrinomonadaceae bacterium]
MGKVEAIRKDKIAPNEPVNIGDKAIDNLKFIRETMERAAHFTAILGYGGALMGVTAIGAAIIAQNQTTIREWLITWIVEAVLAFCIGMLAMWQKAKNAGDSLASAPARKFALAFAPPLVAAVVLTSLFYFKSLFALMPTVWLTLYGTAIVTGGAYSVKIVPIVGWMFIALGLVSVFVDARFGNLLMAAGFGALQIVFGLIVARKYGG